MKTYRKLLSRLAEDGATYENWIQYQDLARLTAKHYNQPEETEYEELAQKFFDKAGLAGFTAEQLSEGMSLPYETVLCNYKWSTFDKEWINA